MKIYLESKSGFFFAKNQVGVDSKSAPDSLGFVLSLALTEPIDKISSGTCVIATSLRGDQTESYLKIKEVQKIEGLETDIYNVAFSLKCKLYLDLDKSTFFRTLNNSEMRVQVTLPHK